MISKRYRLQIDLDVTLDDITIDKCARIYERRREAWAKHGFSDLPESVHEGPDRWAIESAQALWEAIVKDPALVDTWFRSSILLHAEEEVARVSDRAPSDDDILHPAVESLPPRARHWWRQSFADDADDMTMERMEYLFQFLKIKCHPATVLELEANGEE